MTEEGSGAEGKIEERQRHLSMVVEGWDGSLREGERRK